MVEIKKHGLRDIKTAIKRKITILPHRRKGTGYLDLYMLDKRKEKLKKEKDYLEGRLKETNSDLKQVKKEMKRLQRIKGEQMEKKKDKTEEEKFQEHLPDKDWKRVPFNY